MADDTGALGSNYEIPVSPVSGKVVAHGLAGTNDLGTLQGALSALIDPERSAQTERQAFWAGAAGPNTGGMSSVSNAMTAQVAARDAQDKLRAAYIPLIMQTMTQQRANDLGYAKFAQERAEKVTPLINSALYGMQAGDKTPDLASAHKRIDETGAMFSMSPQELLPHHIALHSGAGPNGENLPSYLQQLRVAAAPATEGITKFGTNAAGQTITQNPVQGTIGMPSGGQDSTNPSKTSVEIDKMYRSDPGKYTDDLTGTVSAYNDIMQRGNAIQSNLNSFQPGKYSKSVSGIAAATKDLERMFPNATTKTINDYVTSLMGPSGTGADANPVAAAQFAESLKTQETLAQLKSSLEGQGRIGQTEFRSLNSAMLGIASDPKAFEKFMDFTRGRAANVTNKLKAWGDYAKASGDKLSVPSFEIPWQVNEATQLIGKPGESPAFGQVNVPANVKNPAVPNQAVPTVVQPPAQPPVQPPAVPKPQIRLEDYEPGAKIGPTGVVYVIEKGIPRPAKQRGVSGKVQ